MLGVFDWATYFETGDRPTDPIPGLRIKAYL